MNKSAAHDHQFLILRLNAKLIFASLLSYFQRSEAVQALAGICARQLTDQGLACWLHVV